MEKEQIVNYWYNILAEISSLSIKNQITEKIQYQMKQKMEKRRINSIIESAKIRGRNIAEKEWSSRGNSCVESKTNSISMNGSK